MFFTILQIGVFFGLLSGLFQIFGYISYAKHTFSERITPNLASWAIWTFGAVLESISYIFVTGDAIKNILPVTCTICVIVLFIVLFTKGYFSKPSSFEIFIVVLDIIILTIWFFTSSAVLANILFVLTAIISFIPIINWTYQNPLREHATPWFLWTAAYLFMTITVFIRWEKIEDLIYPVIFFFLHLIVAYLALNYRQKNVVRA